ncbi:MAG: hypothetical protein H7312_19235 [Tardiphaga sp.]|nr:hypothetical protein [Tardiphaga sp.]
MRGGRIGRGQRVKIHVDVRGAGSKVDQRRDLGIDAGLGNHHADIGMADQHNRTILRGQHTLGRGNVVGQ